MQCRAMISPHTCSMCTFQWLSSESLLLIYLTFRITDQTTNALIGTAVCQLTLTLATHSNKSPGLSIIEHTPSTKLRLTSLDMKDYIYRSSFSPPGDFERRIYRSKSPSSTKTGHRTHLSHEQPHYIKLRTRHRRPSSPQTKTRHFHPRLPRPLHRSSRSHRNTMVSR
jgi:hypothetical protein